MFHWAHFCRLLSLACFFYHPPIFCPKDWVDSARTVRVSQRSKHVKGYLLAGMHKCWGRSAAQPAQSAASTHLVQVALLGDLKDLQTSLLLPHLDPLHPLQLGVNQQRPPRAVRHDSPVFSGHSIGRQSFIVPSGDLQTCQIQCAQTDTAACLLQELARDEVPMLSPAAPHTVPTLPPLLIDQASDPQWSSRVVLQYCMHTHGPAATNHMLKHRGACQPFGAREQHKNISTARPSSGQTDP